MTALTSGRARKIEAAGSHRKVGGRSRIVDCVAVHVDADQVRGPDLVEEEAMGMGQEPALPRPADATPPSRWSGPTCRTCRTGGRPRPCPGAAPIPHRRKSWNQASSRRPSHSPPARSGLRSERRAEQPEPISAGYPGDLVIRDGRERLRTERPNRSVRNGSDAAAGPYSAACASVRSNCGMTRSAKSWMPGSVANLTKG